MDKEINLLTSEKETAGTRRNVQVLRFVSLGLLFLIVAFSIGLFFLILASPLPSVRREESSVSSQLQAQRTKSAQLFYIRERLGEITTILAKRPHFVNIIDNVTGLIPPEATVEQLSLLEGSLSLTVSSPSLLPLQMFIEEVKQLKDENIIQSVSLSELSYDETRSGYKATLSVTF